MEQNAQEKNEMTINLDELKEMIGGKQKTPKKPSKTEINEEFRRRLVHFLLHHFAVEGEEVPPNFCPSWPEPGFKFRTIITKEGPRKLIRISQDDESYNVCTNVAEVAFDYEVTDYCHKKLGSKNIPGSAVNLKEIKEIRHLWLSTSTTFKEEKIKPVAEKSDRASLCWHRLPFDIPKVAGETPTFDEMFSRFSNAKALMAFIGSLFFKDADKQQYVWIYGEGMNSKGRLAHFLSEILGPAYSPQMAPASDPNQFWTKALLGKRLVVFSDLDNKKFVATAFFKNLTGDNAQRIEDKGGDTYSRYLETKYLLIGNVKPLITGSTSDKRRAILVMAAPLRTKPIATVTYNAMLMKEAADFLRKAIDTYNELCPGHTSIPTEVDDLDELLKENYEDEISIFNLLFRFCTPQELELPAARQPKVAYAQVEELLRNNHFDQPGRVARFHSFLKDYLKLEKKRTRNAHDNSVQKIVSVSYLGIVARNAKESEESRIGDLGDKAEF